MFFLFPFFMKPPFRSIFAPGLLTAVFLVGMGFGIGGAYGQPGTKPNSGEPPPEHQLDVKPTSRTLERGALSDRAKNPSQRPQSLWRRHYNRMEEIMREQARLRAQQKSLEQYIAQPDAVSPRMKERLAARLHSLDAKEREIHQKKREILQEITSQSEAIQTELDDAQVDLIAREAGETSPKKLERIKKDLGDVQRFQLFLPRVKESLEQYIDVIPEGWLNPEPPPAPSPLPGAGPVSPDSRRPEDGPLSPGGQAGFREGGPWGGQPFGINHRIHRIEEQIRFLRQKMTDLEIELDELKSLAEQQRQDSQKPDDEISETDKEQNPRMHRSDNAVGQSFNSENRNSDESTRPASREKRPAPSDSPSRYRPPRRAPAPDRAPVPPAGFAPGSQPGMDEGSPSTPPPSNR